MSDFEDVFQPQKKSDFADVFGSTPEHHESNSFAHSLVSGAENISKHIIDSGFLGEPNEVRKTNDAAAEYRQHEDMSDPGHVARAYARRAIPIAQGVGQAADNLVNFGGGLAQQALGVPEHHRLTSHIADAIGRSKPAQELAAESPEFARSMAGTAATVAPVPGKLGGLLGDAGQLASHIPAVSRAAPFLNLASKTLAKKGLNALDVAATNGLIAGANTTGHSTGIGENANPQEFLTGAGEGALGAAAFHAAGHGIDHLAGKAKNKFNEIWMGKKPIPEAPNHMQTPPQNGGLRTLSGRMTPAEVETRIRELGLSPETADEFRSSHLPQNVSPEGASVVDGKPVGSDVKSGKAPLDDAPKVLNERFNSEGSEGNPLPISPGVEGRDRATRAADAREVHYPGEPLNLSADVDGRDRATRRQDQRELEGLTGRAGGKNTIEVQGGDEPPTEQVGPREPVRVEGIQARRLPGYDDNGKPLHGTKAGNNESTYIAQTPEEDAALRHLAETTLHRNQALDLRNLGLEAIWRNQGMPDTKFKVGNEWYKAPGKEIDWNPDGSMKFQMLRDSEHFTKLKDEPTAPRMSAQSTYESTGILPNIDNSSEALFNHQSKLLYNAHDEAYETAKNAVKEFLPKGHGSTYHVNFQGKLESVHIKHENEHYEREVRPAVEKEYKTEKSKLWNEKDANGKPVNTYEKKTKIVDYDRGNGYNKRSAKFLNDYVAKNGDPGLVGNLVRKGTILGTTQAASQSLFSLADAGIASAADGAKTPEEETQDKEFWDDVRGAAYFIAGLGFYGSFSDKLKQTAMKGFTEVLQGQAGKLARLYGDLGDHAQRTDLALGRKGEDQLSRMLINHTVNSVRANFGVHFESQNEKAAALGLLNRKEITPDEVYTQTGVRYEKSPFAKMDDAQRNGILAFYWAKRDLQNRIAKYVDDADHRLRDAYVPDIILDEDENRILEERHIADQAALKTAMGESHAHVKGLAQHLIQGNTATTGLDMLTSKATANAMDFFFLQNPAHHVLNMSDSILMGTANYGPVRMVKAMQTLATDPEMRAIWHDSNIFGNFRQERADLASKFPTYTPPKLGEDFGSDTFNAAATGVMSMAAHFDRNADAIQKLGFKDSSAWTKGVLQGNPDIPGPLATEAWTSMVVDNMRLMGADPLGVNMNMVRASKFGGATLSFVGQPIRVARFVNNALATGQIGKVGYLFLATALLGGSAALDDTLKGVAEHLDPGAMAAIEQSMHAVSIPGIVAKMLGPTGQMFVPDLSSKLSNSAVNPLGFAGVNIGMEGGQQALQAASSLYNEGLQGKTENVPGNAYKLIKAGATVAMPRIPGLGIGTGTVLRTAEGLSKAAQGKDTFYSPLSLGKHAKKHEVALEGFNRLAPIANTVIPGQSDAYQQQAFSDKDKSIGNSGMRIGGGPDHFPKWNYAGYGALLK